MAKLFIVGVLGVAVIAMPIFAKAQNSTASDQNSTASEQNSNIGKQEYESHCAVCHGLDGKGNGPLASILKKKVPDLTTLQKDNNGVFPVQLVYNIIDGTKHIEGHGTPDMPSWGAFFMQQAPAFGGPYKQYDFVTGRILALIGYLSTIQAK